MRDWRHQGISRKQVQLGGGSKGLSGTLGTLLDSLLIEPELPSWRVIVDDSYNLLIGISAGECGARAHQDHLWGHPIDQ